MLCYCWILFYAVAILHQFCSTVNQMIDTPIEIIYLPLKQSYVLPITVRYDLCQMF